MLLDGGMFHHTHTPDQEKILFLITFEKHVLLLTSNYSKYLLFHTDWDYKL